MIITEQELQSSPPPGDQDRSVAARNSSAICLLAALWFFVSPFAFFGYSEQASAWNAWIIGPVAFLVSCGRLLKPLHSTPLSWVNTALGAWIFVSPWVFGYNGNGVRLTNSLSVGLVLIG